VNGEPAPSYRANLALVHHLGFGFHADACTAGILALLGGVRQRRGLVVELGCGSGLLTRHLVDAGHRVVATDASPWMLELAAGWAPGVADLRRLVLPADPVPPADAVVSVGHVLNYLPDEASLFAALAAAAGALRPGGVLALDLCDLRYGQVRRDAPDLVRSGDGWFIATRFATPSPDRFVREMTTFVREDAGGWRRDDERHENVLVDTAPVPAFLGRFGVVATVAASFGAGALPDGLVAVVGRREG
jgi:SAM-dependent methyltransferase